MNTSGNQGYTRSEFAKRFGQPENSVLVNSGSSEFATWLEALKLPEELISDLAQIYIPFCNYVINSKLIVTEKPIIIGINGPQGSGKTTFAHLLANVLRKYIYLKVVCCSIDDFYLTRHEREKLSREVHPLLITRGVPGTHDVDLAIITFKSLIHATGETITYIPVFDKTVDDRKPKEEWIQFRGRPDLIIFEGWCVGAKAVTETELENPINILERTKDQNGKFRRYVNNNLRKKYAEWFDMIGFLIMLKVPGFEQVIEWRWIQEKKLAEKHVNSNTETNLPNRIMTEEETLFFISHFERITRQMLKEMPGRANVVLGINELHSIDRITIDQKLSNT